MTSEPRDIQNPVTGMPGYTRLILDRTEPVIHTADRYTDTRTALTLGLADYIKTITTNAVGGRYISFREVFSSWAEPEQHAEFPSAIVYATGAGTYDASGFTPVPNSKQKVPAPDNRLVVKFAEFIQDLTVEIWCTDPEERQELVAACEEAFNPMSDMYGFILELPHYYNARAVFEMKSLAYQDTEIDAARRYRKAVFSITGQVPLIRLISFPGAKPKAIVDEVGDYVIVNS
jgi:hypothetical protein